MPSSVPTMPTVAICLPSRGLIHSRTLEAVVAALDVAQAQERVRCVGWFLSHDLPIPDSHETTAERALATGAEYVWFVEEDMIPPPDALIALLDTREATGAGIVTIDYPVGEHPTQSAVMHKQDDGSVFWCGLGCTLIHADVFALVARPWFRASHPGVFIRYGSDKPWHWEDTPDAPNVFQYGGQDIWLCYQALLAGMLIAEVPGMRAGHARLRSWGQPLTNEGAHSVDVLTEIEVMHR